MAGSQMFLMEMIMVMTMNRSDVAAAIYTDTFGAVSPDDSDLWMDLFMYIGSRIMGLMTTISFGGSGTTIKEDRDDWY